MNVLINLKILLKKYIFRIVGKSKIIIFGVADIVTYSYIKPNFLSQNAMGHTSNYL